MLEFLCALNKHKYNKRAFFGIDLRVRIASSSQSSYHRRAVHLQNSRNMIRTEAQDRRMPKTLRRFTCWSGTTWTAVDNRERVDCKLCFMAGLNGSLLRLTAALPASGSYTLFLLLGLPHEAANDACENSACHYYFKRRNRIIV